MPDSEDRKKSQKFLEEANPVGAPLTVELIEEGVISTEVDGLLEALEEIGSSYPIVVSCKVSG